MMRTIRDIALVCALGTLCSVAPCVLAADQASRSSPHAKIVSIEGATTTYKVEGMHGQTVTVDLPSQSTADVKLSNTEQRTVHGTVVALDGGTNHVKVHTQEGQTIVLEMSPESLKGLRLGDPFTLAVPRPAGQ